MSNPRVDLWPMPSLFPGQPLESLADTETGGGATVELEAAASSGATESAGGTSGTEGG